MLLIIASFCHFVCLRSLFDVSECQSFDFTMSSGASSVGKDDSVIDIGSSSDFTEGRGQHVDVRGRPLSIFRHDGALYALDHHCYHSGGPLALGDIEDLVLNQESHPCVVCPWHKYKISLKTGEGIYLHSDPFAKRKTAKLKSKGKKQRTHKIFEDKNGRVMVVLDLSENIQFGSDYYASEDFQLLMKRRRG